MSDTICFTTVGITQMNDGDLFSIVPNPFTHEFTISGLANDAKINMYDIFGREVLSVPLNASNVRIPTSHLSKGIYLLEIITEKERIVGKVIKE